MSIGHYFICSLVVVCPIFICSSHSLAENGGMVERSETVQSLVPDRDVHYANENRTPQWKLDWDQARALYRQGKIGQALVQYELLLQKKNTIEEARWEYTALLLEDRRWQQAARELDTLLAHAPDKWKYLQAQARVSLELGLAEQAVRQYRHLYEVNTSHDKVRARKVLTGLVDALGLMGDKEAQFPLLEKLVLQKPGDCALVKQAVALALALGRVDKARNMVEKPLRNYPNDETLLRLSARAREQCGDREGAASRMQELVALKPYDSEANAWLSSYYLQEKNIEMALVHLVRQLQSDPGASELLQLAARLYAQQGQPGKALDYYALYLDRVPGDQVAFAERERTRRVLATDLVTLVTNEKAEQL